MRLWAIRIMVIRIKLRSSFGRHPAQFLPTKQVMSKSLTAFASKELKLIHAQSRRYNRAMRNDHAQALLEMISHHADEINALYKKGNTHYVVETGDLVVLCMELIKEAKHSPDKVLNKCYGRFRRKLSGLLEERKRI